MLVKLQNLRRICGQEVGFNIPDHPVVRETVSILSENKRLMNRPSIHDYLNDVIALDSDEIENDDWDDDPLLDENLVLKPRSRKSSQQRSKRKLAKETLEDRRVKAGTRLVIHETQKTTVDGLQCGVSNYSHKCSTKQRRSDNVTGVWLDVPESSRKSRRLVEKDAEPNITDIATIDAERQNRTHADDSELHVALSLSNDSDDLSTEIEAIISARLDTISTVHGQSRHEVNPMNDLDPLLNKSSHDNALNAKGRNVEEISPDVSNSNGDKLGRDQSTADASIELSCVICWTEYSSVRGVLPCGHRFCFPCIQNWADHMRSNRKEPTCPLCKAAFVSFTRVEAAATLDQKIYSQTIPFASSSQDIYFVPEGRTGFFDVEITPLPVCCYCQSRDPADMLIECRVCHSSRIHSYCLDPPLFPWTCIGCRHRRVLFRS
ncbi:uncharacterized protein LOC104883257 isoform X2 [Beta vulgaris subsp. vulgaris]|uniref:uncharacterized protein LOC104883257 isoform X2 n=1 Tax=Beta vulgaris subsp. vulgaris TaxID=3555 RepID=UPI0005402ECE|nr:uncharacterized protein LOC104883257 isoform X2 [Beta vulgaris subsp. vulgaris]XP_048495139.1 uncharacterized protein LOC104883257 isoform X2 [Beta vulgaris subsp. vulgaris]